MKRIKPSNGHQIEDACLDYILGAECSIFKPELMEYAAGRARVRQREERAKAEGFSSWEEMRKSRDSDFMDMLRS